MLVKQPILFRLWKELHSMDMINTFPHSSASGFLSYFQFLDPQDGSGSKEVLLPSLRSRVLNPSAYMAEEKNQLPHTVL